MLAQKGITAKATYKLTYSNSDGKFLVSDIVSQNIVDGDNLMLDTGFIQDEQTEKPDQTGTNGGANMNNCINLTGRLVEDPEIKN